MGGERSMGGKGAHLGDFGWPTGRGCSRRRAGPVARESGMSLDEQGRSRTSGRRRTDGRSRGGGLVGGAEAGTSEWPANPPVAGSRGRARA